MCEEEQFYKCLRNANHLDLKDEPRVFGIATNLILYICHFFHSMKQNERFIRLKNEYLQA